MKQFFSKIISFLLALFVLFSTFSFTVEKHYCGDFLVDVSFTGETDACKMDVSKEVTQVKKGCCKDEIHKVEGQDQLQTNKIDKITFEKEQFLTAFLISYRDLFVLNESKNKFYSNFSPPNYYGDYQVLYQTFLI
ncbi:HYC_CC_PP family protein [Polaribacter sp. Asnod1-A03]|uniref:HYC_CC_PP family protein n=1 Tax=Polaribacter sp. Asnod1-A03 TaxID=3160581 RepID=UPI00386EA36F